MTIGNSLGARVAAYRKTAGFEKAEEFADAIANPRITKSVIQNIESGRKADIAVSELLEISKALGLSPIFLLGNMSDRSAPICLANVSDEISQMSGDDLDAWVSMNHTSPIPGPDGSRWAQSATHAVHLQRALRNTVARWSELEGDGDEVAHARYDLGQEARNILNALERRFPFVDVSWVPTDLLALVQEVERQEEIELARMNNYAGYEDAVRGMVIYGDD